MEENANPTPEAGASSVQDRILDFLSPEEPQLEPQSEEQGQEAQPEVEAEEEKQKPVEEQEVAEETDEAEDSSDDVEQEQYSTADLAQMFGEDKRGGNNLRRCVRSTNNFK